MKLKDLWLYVAGFIMGAAMAIVISTWGEAATGYQIGYVVLLVLLAYVTWSKQKSHNSNSKTNNDPLYAVVRKPHNEGSNNAAKS
jgi:uncharacterized membrane protein YfcA